MPTVANGDHSNVQNGRVLPFYLLFNGGLGDLLFPVPPEQLTVSMPSRVTAIQTKRGIHFDDFGEGIITVTIAGSFGWRKNDINNLTGKETHAALCLLWQRRQAAVKAGDPEQYTVTFVDTQDGLVLDCVIPDFQSVRSMPNGQITKYQLTLQAVKVQRLFQGLPSNSNTALAATGAVTQSVGQQVSAALPGGGLPTRHSSRQLFDANLSAGSGPALASYTPAPGESLIQVAQAVFQTATPTSEELDELRTLNALRNRGDNVPVDAPILFYRNPAASLSRPLA